MECIGIFGILMSISMLILSGFSELKLPNYRVFQNVISGNSEFTIGFFRTGILYYIKTSIKNRFKYLSKTLLNKNGVYLQFLQGVL